MHSGGHLWTKFSFLNELINNLYDQKWVQNNFYGKRNENVSPLAIVWFKFLSFPQKNSYFKCPRTDCISVAGDPKM
jgi:hypothetical protein